LTVNHFNKVIPQYQVAQQGQTVHYYCASWSEVKWTFNNNTLPSNAVAIQNPGSIQNILRIINIQENNTGLYICTSKSYHGTLVGHGRLNVVGE